MRSEEVRSEERKKEDSCRDRLWSIFRTRADHSSLPHLYKVVGVLTTRTDVVILSNMGAQVLLNERRVLSESAFVEMVVWRLDEALPGSAHILKCRLALVVDGMCVLRYDNESSKGDHKHVGDKEEDYIFTTAEALLRDFWQDVDKWRF